MLAYIIGILIHSSFRNLLPNIIFIMLSLLNPSTKNVPNKQFKLIKIGTELLCDGTVRDMI